MRKLTISIFLLTVASAFGGTLSVSPNFKSVANGQSFTLDVSVDGISDLYAWQVDLGFDPTLIRADGVDEGPFLTSLGSTTFFIAGDIDNIGGTVSFNANTIIGADPGVSGTGVLATFHFTALAPGLSSITLFNETLLDSFTQGIAVDVNGGSVEVTAPSGGGVPEPSTIVFSTLGLLACACVRRFRR